MLHETKNDVNFIFEKELKLGDLMGLNSECLTDTWIGQDRLVFPF